MLKFRIELAPYASYDDAAAMLTMAHRTELHASILNTLTYWYPSKVVAVTLTLP
jgi:hypothetical protein